MDTLKFILELISSPTQETSLKNFVVSSPQPAQLPMPNFPKRHVPEEHTTQVPQLVLL
jgi:hypothetical protein